MCGRALLKSDYSAIKVALKLSNLFAAPNLKPSWNIAPTDDMVCVIRDEKSGARKTVKMRWGLIPSWTKDPKIRFSTFNARAETITQTSAFRDAWRAGRRCLVITDGFYEWRKADKQPFAIACVEGSLTVMAGLWEEWKSPEGEIITSCTIITTSANDLLAPIHDRMPVILAEADWPAWLGEQPATEAELLALLKPYTADKMRLWPIDKRVGNVRNNDANLIIESAPLLL